MQCVGSPALYSAAMYESQIVYIYIQPITTNITASQYEVHLLKGIQNQTDPVHEQQNSV